MYYTSTVYQQICHSWRIETNAFCKTFAAKAFGFSWLGDNQIGSFFYKLSLEQLRLENAL
jgi:hypothetical protein